MKKTTLCYIEKDHKYLMLHRTKLKNDMNHDKWLGIGGKFEKEETCDECVLREVMEETGLTLTKYTLRGIVSFISDIYDDEEMYLYHSDSFSGTITQCKEGELEWIDIDKITDLPIWEGDRIFLKLLRDNHPFFRLKLFYEGDTLINASLNGTQLNI